MKPGQARIIVLLLVLLVLELLIHPGVKTFISGTYQKINSLLQGSTGSGGSVSGNPVLSFLTGTQYGVTTTDTIPSGTPTKNAGKNNSCPPGFLYDSVQNKCVLINPNQRTGGTPPQK